MHIYIYIYISEKQNQLNKLKKRIFCILKNFLFKYCGELNLMRISKYSFVKFEFIKYKFFLFDLTILSFFCR
jgi:hypothetical protein